MSTASRDQLLDHDFDGIQEYDNPCPGWWHMLLWGSILFSGLYFVHYHLHPEPTTLAGLYDASVANDLKLQFAEIGTLSPDEPTLVKYMQDEQWLKFGQAVFKSQCVSCHGANGQGMVGPNLTDGLYKNVKVITDIAKVIGEGANNGAMPAWKNRLHPNEVVLVSAYTASLRGQNLAGPGVAGEQEIPPWPK